MGGWAGGDPSAGHSEAAVPLAPGIPCTLAEAFGNVASAVMSYPSARAGHTWPGSACCDSLAGPFASKPLGNQYFGWLQTCIFPGLFGGCFLMRK